MKKTLLASIVVLFCCTAAAATDFYVVVPVKGRTAQAVGDPVVMLNPAALPGAEVGKPYAFDFRDSLHVTGDPGFSAAGVQWSAAGLPVGLSLNAGTGQLRGTPSAAESNSFTVTASYKTASGSQDYVVEVVQPIQVMLSSVPLAPKVSVPYSYDLAQQLSVRNDSAFTGAGVVWKVTGGALPSGLNLNAASGIVSGQAVSVGATDVSISATYKERTGQAVYHIDVQLSANIKQFNGYRAWSDNTLAASCNAYRNPAAGYKYEGSTGDGVYRISVNGAPMDVNCDMTTDGGGWTQVINAINGQYDPWWTTANGLRAPSTGAPTGALAWKMADANIQALTTIALRLRSPEYGITRYVKPACHYGHNTPPSVENGCGTTYSSLNWADPKNFVFTGANTAGGISDYDLSTDSMYFQTADSRYHGWFAGDNRSASNSYRSGYGFNGGASYLMWVK